jgi:hypothetical protein
MAVASRSTVCSKAVGGWTGLKSDASGSRVAVKAD